MFNGFFYICDCGKFLQQYKLPRKPAQEPSTALVRQTLLKEAVAHSFTGPVIMLLAAGPLIRHINPGSAVAPGAIPGFCRMWYQLLVCFLVNECMFYAGHRLLHSKALYKHIHKQHHSYIGTRSFAAEYAHVAEDFLTAYIPFLTGIFITKAHFYTVFLWFFCRLTETYEAHSGYCFKGTIAHRIGISHAESAAHHGSSPPPSVPRVCTQPRRP